METIKISLKHWLKPVEIEIENTGYGKYINVYQVENELGMQVNLFLDRELAEQEARDSDSIITIPLWIE